MMELEKTYYKNGVAFATSYELLKYLSSYYLSCKIHYNGKTIKRNKMIQLLKNNISINSTFKIVGNHLQLPYYKGDYKYFKNNYGVVGYSRITKTRIYITILENS